MIPEKTKILSRKEIAHAIGRNVSYVSAMRKAGFPHIVNTPREAIAWLKAHPDFRKNAKEKAGFFDIF